MEETSTRWARAAQTAVEKNELQEISTKCGGIKKLHTRPLVSTMAHLTTALVRKATTAARTAQTRRGVKDSVGDVGVLGTQQSHQVMGSERRGRRRGGRRLAKRKNPVRHGQWGGLQKYETGGYGMSWWMQEQ